MNANQFLGQLILLQEIPLPLEGASGLEILEVLLQEDNDGLVLQPGGIRDFLLAQPGGRFSQGFENAFANILRSGALTTFRRCANDWFPGNGGNFSFQGCNGLSGFSELILQLIHLG